MGGGGWGGGGGEVGGGREGALYHLLRIEQNICNLQYDYKTSVRNSCSQITRCTKLFNIFSSALDGMF